MPFLPIFLMEEYIVKKFLAFSVLFCCLFLYRAEATTVSFLVIETGLEEDSPSRQHSGLWESGLLDEFFNAGFIVSNAPILRLDRKPSVDLPNVLLGEVENAIEGGADFFIYAMLDYNSQLQHPDNISLRMFRINPIRKIHEQNYSVRASSSLQEDFDNIKIIARGLVPHLNAR